jgi:polyhydroxyalkanoate synthesis repressor PhaR
MSANTSDKATGPSSERSRRVIKRYSNRKLYDTRDSRYVTLSQIAEMVRTGEDVQIIDNASKEDKTEVTLALIISEELKTQPRAVSLGTLRDLIQERGGGPAASGGVGIDPGGSMTSQRPNDTGRQGAPQPPIRDTAAAVAELRTEIRRLADRVAALEARFGAADRGRQPPG